MDMLTGLVIGFFIGCIFRTWGWGPVREKAREKLAKRYSK